MNSNLLQNNHIPLSTATEGGIFFPLVRASELSAKLALTGARGFFV